MKSRSIQTLSVLFAVMLQVLPLLRTLVTSPAASSSFAFILRWGLGSAAALGTVDAVSGASGTVMNTSSNITGTVGVALNFTNNFVINGGNTAIPSDYIYLTSWNGVNSTPNLTNGATTTAIIPPGLTYKCYAINNSANIYGVITGIPTSAVTTNLYISAVDAKGGYVFTTNIHFSISAAASLPPVITNQPVSLTNLLGATARFSVTNGGSAPLKYQWYFNTNTPLLNATNTSLSLTNVQFTNAGTYSVIITNPAGAATSAPARLTVWQAPVITAPPPAVLALLAGQSAAISVTASGTPAVTFQWVKDNGSLANGGVYGGALTSTLTLTGVSTGNSGSYSVVITNSAGAVTSSVTAVSIALPPSVIASSPTPGSVQFNATTVTGLTYVIQAATDLTAPVWVPVYTNNTGVSGALSFATNTASGGQQFFRVQFP